MLLSSQMSSEHPSCPISQNMMHVGLAMDAFPVQACSAEKCFRHGFRYVVRPRVGALMGEWLNVFTALGALGGLAGGCAVRSGHIRV